MMLSFIDNLIMVLSVVDQIPAKWHRLTFTKHQTVDGECPPAHKNITPHKVPLAEISIPSIISHLAI